MWRTVRAKIGGRFWGRTLAQGGLRTWMQEGPVRRYINQSVTGSPDCWPIEWLRDHLQPRCFATAISLGCGEGALERDLAAKGLCASILGLDISQPALDLARSRAAALGLDGISYRQADLNDLVLPAGTFEAAFFHQSLHHVENLDACLAAVASALTPGALVYFDEYVGPSRSEWSRSLLSAADQVFARLPAAVRRSRHLRLPVDWRDPRRRALLRGDDRYVVRRLSARRRWRRWSCRCRRSSSGRTTRS